MIKTYETKFDVGQNVYYNSVFNGSVAPRFKITTIWITDFGDTYGIVYECRQLFDHLEYQRREGITTETLRLKEGELSEVMLKES